MTCPKCYHAPCICDMRKEMASQEKRIAELEAKLEHERRKCEWLAERLNEQGLVDEQRKWKDKDYWMDKAAKEQTSEG